MTYIIDDILNPLLMSVWWHTLQMHKVERGLLSAGSTRSSSVAGDSITSEIGKKVRRYSVYW